MSFTYNAPTEERVYYESRVIVIGESVAKDQTIDPAWEPSGVIYRKSSILSSWREDQADGAAFFGEIICGDRFMVTTKVGCSRDGDPVHIRPMDDERTARLATQRAFEVLIEVLQKREQELIDLLRAENDRLHQSNIWLLKRMVALLSPADAVVISGVLGDVP